MIRLSGILNQLEQGVSHSAYAFPALGSACVDSPWRRLGGLPPIKELELIDSLIIPMRQRQWLLWSTQILPELAKNNIFIMKVHGLRPSPRVCTHLTSAQHDELSKQEQDALRIFFERSILPILTPLMVDPSHPFPFISNLSMNFAIIMRHDIEGSMEKHFARLKGAHERTHVRRSRAHKNPHPFPTTTVGFSTIVYRFSPSSCRFR